MGGENEPDRLQIPLSNGGRRTGLAAERSGVDDDGGVALAATGEARVRLIRVVEDREGAVIEVELHGGWAKHCGFWVSNAYKHLITGSIADSINAQMCTYINVSNDTHESSQVKSNQGGGSRCSHPHFDGESCVVWEGFRRLQLLANEIKTRNLK